MLTSTTKTAYRYKKGEEVALSEIAGFAQMGMPWHEPIVERFQGTPTRTRITQDTTIEITMVQGIGK